MRVDVLSYCVHLSAWLQAYRIKQAEREQQKQNAREHALRCVTERVRRRTLRSGWITFTGET